MDLNEKKILFANGCSHVVGSEIEGPEIGWVTPYNLHWSFAGQLSRRYDLEYVNIAKPAGCNHRIYRSTLNWAMDFLEKGGDPSDVFMLIGWTTNVRTEFYYNDEWFQWTIGAKSEFYPHDFTSLFKHLTVYFSSEKAGVETRISYTVGLNTILETWGFEHLMFNTFRNHSDYSFDVGEVAFSKKFFPFHAYFEPNGSFIGRYLEKEKNHITKHLHGDKYVHGLYCDVLDEYIKTYDPKPIGR